MVDNDVDTPTQKPSQLSEVVSALQVLIKPSSNASTFLLGTVVSDLLVGTSSDDSMNGWRGHDRLNGQADNDHVVDV